MLITASIDFVYINRRARRREKNRIYIYTFVRNGKSQLETANALDDKAISAYLLRMRSICCGAVRSKVVVAKQTCEAMEYCVHYAHYALLLLVC